MHDSPWHVQWVIRVRRSRSRLACVRCLAPHTGPTLCCRACQVAISDAVEYTRERRRASGECPYCGDPIESGAACARCRERMRVAKARARRMRPPNQGNQGTTMTADMKCIATVGNPASRLFVASLIEAELEIRRRGCPAPYEYRLTNNQVIDVEAAMAGDGAGGLLFRGRPVRVILLVDGDVPAGLYSAGTGHFVAIRSIGDRATAAPSCDYAGGARTS